MSVLNFFNNFRYLFRYNLKEIFKCSVEKLSDELLIEEVLYEIPDSNVFRPQIETHDKTVERLVTTSNNIVRFGDGEVAIINGKNIPFQKYDTDLASKLKEILIKDQANLLVGINFEYYYPFNIYKMNEIPAKFMRTFVPKLRLQFSKYLNKDKKYYSAGFTQLYQLYREYDFERNFNCLKKIWDNKKIVIVTCENSLKNLKYNIFENAFEIKKEIVPAKDCWSRYEKILNNLKRYDKDYIFILMCGPTAKVLVSDLTFLGYRALDLGHIAKDYDWYKKQIPHNQNNCDKFFSPDV